MRWFWQPKSGNNQVMTDEMSAKSLETRQLNAKIQQLEARLDSKQKLQILEEVRVVPHSPFLPYPFFFFLQV